MIRVLIVDDHPIVRQGLKQTLEDCEGIRVCGEAGRGSEALQILREENFDVALVDISMPGRSGIEVLKQIKAANISVAVLILSTYPEDQYALRALKAGASGYLSKNCEPGQLVAAIRKVSRGGKYVSPELAERMVMDLNNGTEEAPHQRLSDREYEVLCKIASGHPVSAIAQEMSLSVKTISTYRTRILEKTRMKNNAELTHYAIKNNLVD